MSLSADERSEALMELRRPHVRRGDRIELLDEGGMPSEAELEAALAARRDQRAARRQARRDARAKLKNPGGVTTPRELAEILDQILPEAPASDRQVREGDG